MEEFMQYYEEEYDDNLTKQNQGIGVKIQYLNKSTKIFFDSRRQLFKYNYDTTLYQHLKTLTGPTLRYVNFTYESGDFKYIISYNFVHKVIIVYMGNVFNPKHLEKTIYKLPVLDGFKVISNEFLSSFRNYLPAFEEIIVDNIMKFISNHPMEFKKLVSFYISKSFNFRRLGLNEKGVALHKNLNILDMFVNYMLSVDGKYLVALKYLSPSPDLVFNIGNETILVDVYDRQSNLIRVFELPPFDLIQISEVRVYILVDDYEMNFDECYNLILGILTEKFFQSKPLNNNSPSSE